VTFQHNLSMLSSQRKKWNLLSWLRLELEAFFAQQMASKLRLICRRASNKDLTIMSDSETCYYYSLLKHMIELLHSYVFSCTMREQSDRKLQRTLRHMVLDARGQSK